MVSNFPAITQRTRSQSLKSPGKYGKSQSANHVLCTTSTIASRNLQENENWISIQQNVAGLFHRQKCEEKKLSKLHENIRKVWSADVGPFLFEFYVKKVLNQGMKVLLDRNVALEGMDLLKALNGTWEYLYTEIIPTLQAIFYPVKAKQMNIRHITLVCFRDVVILKLPIKEALLNANQDFPPGIQQMLLILQGTQYAFNASIEQLSIEILVALVVSPYLGILGLYQGSEHPVVWTKKQANLNDGKSKNIHPRPLRRQISAQTFRSTENSLEEMFHQAYARNQEFI